MPGLGDLDVRILRELMEDGRIPITRLAERVGAPRTTVASRLARMEEAGLVEGYRAVVSAERLGYRITAFVLVKVRRTRPVGGRSNQELLAERIVEMTSSDRRLPWVEEAHIITGEYDLLLKVRASELDQLTRFLISFMATHEDVVQTHTLLSLERVHEDHSPRLPSRKD